MTFANQEAIPFRFTPNIQHFITPVGIEGVFTASILAIAKALTESSEFSDYLSLFVRDELNAVLVAMKKPVMEQSVVKEAVAVNVDVLVRRAGALGGGEEGGVPSGMNVLDLISQAVNPLKLAQMDLNYIPSL
jgi:transformation/transcription domain-associated protein